ncbi:hypothetical protein C8R43DRAFT_41203 [Mycena crocata]|nr:hypothetical protein C8R43DRAFT_41203 [Mycena crocata]
MTDLVLRHRSRSSKFRRAFSGTLRLQDKWSTSNLAALAPIIELDEPDSEDEDDENLAIYQDSSTPVCIPSKPDFRRAVSRPFASSNKQATPTVEFTSLSLSEDVKCDPSWQSISGKGSSVLDGCILYGGKRIREPESDEGRVSAKRQRLSSPGDNGAKKARSIRKQRTTPAREELPTIALDTKLELHVLLPRRSILPGEKSIQSLARKRTFAEVEQSADELIAEASRYSKRKLRGDNARLTSTCALEIIERSKSSLLAF